MASMGLLVLNARVKNSYSLIANVDSLVERRSDYPTLVFVSEDSSPAYSELSIRADKHVCRNPLSVLKNRFSICDVDVNNLGIMSYLCTMGQCGIVKNIVQGLVLRLYESHKPSAEGGGTDIL